LRENCEHEVAKKRKMTEMLENLFEFNQ